MAFIRPNWRLAILAVFISAIYFANANIQQERAQLSLGKRVSSSHTAIQPYSKIQCVKKCVEEGRRGRCSVAGYDKDTQTCYLSINSMDSVMETPEEVSGVFVFQQQETGTTAWFSNNMC